MFDTSTNERKPYNAFEDLYRSVGLGQKDLMAMFTVYFDESYGTANAYSVAGYVSTIEQWGEFEREWKELLKDFNIEYMHKRELEHLRGQFSYAKDWPKEKQRELRVAVNKRACGIILRRVNAGFAASVYKTDWQEFDKGRWAFALGESFYAAGAFQCLKLVSSWIHRFNRNEPIYYVFEKGAEGQKEVRALLERTEKDPEARAFARMAGWSFESKKDEVIKGVRYPGVVPLQAADFLAYEMYRHMDNRVVEGIKRDKNGNEIPARRALVNLLQKDKPQYDRLRDHQLPVPYFMLFLNKPKIEELMEMLDDYFGLTS
jgi:hypothetical protein